MTDSKSTKRSLAASIGCIALCVVMLIGTTFAWFTDTATTGVSKVQAGTLDVQLEMYDGENWVSAEGKTLEFAKAKGGEEENVLWEPNCTYELPALRVKNNGNLALKYKIQITGIKGDAKLNEAIDWTISDKVLDTDHKLAAHDTSSNLTIKGTMKSTAGNMYQGLSIEGITVTVVATQDTVEHDSIDDKYDQNATYPAVASFVKATAEGTMDEGEDATSISDDDGVVEALVPAGTADPGTTVALVVDRTAMSADSVTFDIDFQIDGKTLTGALDNPITAKVNIGKNLKNVKVAHNGTAMTESDSAKDQTYSYDASTGYLTIVTKSFSPFTVTYDAEVEAVVNGVAYASIVDALDSASAGSTVVLQKDARVTLNDCGSDAKNADYTLFFGTPNITLDLNGKTLTTTSNYGGSYNVLNIMADGWTVKNGTIITKRANGAADSYALGIECENGKATLENLKLCGGVAAYDTVTVSMNNIESVMATNYYCCYAESGAKFVINGGKYIWNTEKSIFYATATSSIEAISGEFDGTILWGDGKLSVTGGTFNNDPTNYVDTTNYNVTNNGGTWTVAAK